MRKKIAELEMACDGRFTTTHGQMCRLHLGAYDHLSAQIAVLDQLVAEAAAPFGRLIARLMTIPGIGPRTAQVIVAETGGDMARFATPARLAAWAGLAPGDNESAGKRKKAPARMVTSSCARRWWNGLDCRPDAHGPVPGSGGWPAGSAAATRRKPPIAVAHT